MLQTEGEIVETESVNAGIDHSIVAPQDNSDLVQAPLILVDGENLLEPELLAESENLTLSHHDSDSLPEQPPSTPAIMILIELIGAVALLLWGLRMVNTGMIRGYGYEIRKGIEAGTKNRFLAFLSGIFATMLLQSSTATVLMTVSFAAAGMMTTAAAIAVMLGADLGTAIVAQVLTLDLKWLAPLLIFIGFTRDKSGSNSRHHSLAKILVGLGLMLLALRLLGNATSIMKQSDVIQNILINLTDQYVFAALIAALLTFAAHSSLAIVLLITSLAQGGALDLTLAFALVLGANLGGLFPPWMATSGLDDKTARRVPMANIIMRGSMVFICLMFIKPITGLFEKFAFEPSSQIVNFHFTFNFVLALVFFMFVPLIAKTVTNLFPKIKENDRAARHLDETLLETPSMAIEAAARETFRMAEEVDFMLSKAMQAFSKNNLALIEEVIEMDDLIDALYEEIKLYMTRIGAEEIDQSESHRYNNIMIFVINLESIGDIIDKNLMDMARKKAEKRLMLSDEGFADIMKLHNVVRSNAIMAMKLLLINDSKIARRLLDAKIKVRDMAQESNEAHLERLGEGRKESIETSSIHLDLLRDLKRINSHFTSIAYSQLEQAGELSQSRLKKRYKKPLSNIGKPETTQKSSIWDNNPQKENKEKQTPYRKVTLDQVLPYEDSENKEDK